ncbi:Pathogen-associated molecular patterns-induced protein A70 [Camellia lanceoleosa]|uniref:Pathogen-associated molecular patterns-induced protein A70 n=1 Tax=Camellia lanceoleosa TaxID=1840588 RepID=A0ACC0J0E7_9ERIC|nr:Pathogen-associated molecular patterns-induced protein A70 [Camellia lanceoleosa]
MDEEWGRHNMGDGDSTGGEKNEEIQNPPNQRPIKILNKPIFSKDDSRSLDEVYNYHANKTKSNTNPASGEFLEKLLASTKLTFAHFEEDEIMEARRPATVKEGRVSTETVKDEQVDAKADDFINKFRQQLKLQRLDSIRRYKDMISKEVAK